MKQFERDTIFKLQPQDLFENISLCGPPLEANGTAQAGALDTMDPWVLNSNAPKRPNKTPNLRFCSV